MRSAFCYLGLTLLLFPASALGHGGASDPQELADHWIDSWTFSPLQLAPFLIVGVLYGLRAAQLGSRLSRWRILSFYSGLALGIFAIVSPIDEIAEEGLFAVHMFQHALLGGFAPLLAVAGLTGPVLQPLLKVRLIQNLRVIAHPVVALPLWVAVFIFWHVPPIYEFGVENDIAHGFEHASFFATTALVWGALLEPLPAPHWFGTGPKIIYSVIFWFAGLLAVNIFWFSGTVFYERYEETAPAWGISALQDQANAGTVFMAEHMVLTITTLVVLTIRAAKEGSLRQRLLEAGVDERAVTQAVRYGRAEELAERSGVPVASRGGID